MFPQISFLSFSSPVLALDPEFVAYYPLAGLGICSNFPGLVAREFAQVFSKGFPFEHCGAPLLAARFHHCTMPDTNTSLFGIVGAPHVATPCHTCTFYKLLP